MLLSPALTPFHVAPAVLEKNTPPPIVPANTFGPARHNILHSPHQARLSGPIGGKSATE